MTWINLPILAQLADDGFPGGAAPNPEDLMAAMIVPLIGLAIMSVIGIVIGWKIFTKAGKPGWASIVPIYQNFVMAEICGRPVLWAILSIIPCTLPIAVIVFAIDIAHRFGKGTGYGIGLLIPGVNVILGAMLAFGDAKYTPAPPATV